MAHSKRNTSLAFFTSYERSLLKSTWGSQATRLTRDSFLPFGSCQLCLLPSRDPVACATGGEIFCRECAVSNLLAQHKEIKRLEREMERNAADAHDAAQQNDDEARNRAIKDFEDVQTGFDGKLGTGADQKTSKNGESGAGTEKRSGREAGLDLPERPEKKIRRFEIDEDELSRIIRDERSRAKLVISKEKKEALKSSLPSFWVPSQTPSTDHSGSADIPRKLHPLCPSSDINALHRYSLKTLVSVNFTEEKDTKTTELARICPSCKKALSNTTKAFLAIPCGHVLCKTCVAAFLQPHEKPDPHNPEVDHRSMKCYVCDADITRRDRPGGIDGKRRKDKSIKDKLKPGLVEIRSEGTGFAGGGKNLIKKNGVVFQC